jgi:hypothetical protein
MQMDRIACLERFPPNPILVELVPLRNRIPASQITTLVTRAQLLCAHNWNVKGEPNISLKGINRYFQFPSQSFTRREEIVADAEQRLSSNRKVAA